MGDNLAMRLCPFCAEEIKGLAVKCRFCGSDIPAGSATPPAAGDLSKVDAANEPRDYLIGRYPVPKVASVHTSSLETDPEPDFQAHVSPPQTELNRSRLQGSARRLQVPVFLKPALPLIATAMFGIVLISVCTRDRSDEGVNKRTSVEAVISRDDRIRRQFSGYDNSHRKVEKRIKESMDDPDSYDHVSTTYKDEGDHLLVTTAFRGKNSFGGIVKNFMIARVDLDGEVVEVMYVGE